jgi:hypothetical protein
MWHTHSRYGEKAGLEWRQENADYLRYAVFGQPAQILARGDANLLPEAHRMTRVPKGHPEGYLEAFANIYSEASLALEAKILGKSCDVPIECATVEDGAIGIAFVDAAVKSSRDGGTWVDPRLTINDRVLATV